MEAESIPAHFVDRRRSENGQFPANGHGIPGRLPDLEKIYAGMQNSYGNFPSMHPMLKLPLENRLDKPERDLMTSWRPPFSQNLHLYHPDAALATLLYSGGYGHMGFADKGMRRNATRETTATLKSWLNEHRKNPYPTKAEKIMLAIISKMTLTQVSTWFANARRRLKKENRMTWLPRNPSKEESDEEEKPPTEEDGRRREIHSPNDVMQNYFTSSQKRNDSDNTNVATSSKEYDNRTDQREKQHQSMRPFPVMSRNALAEKYQKQLQLYAASHGNQPANFSFSPTSDQSRRRDSVTSPSTSAGSYDRSPSPYASFVCLPPHKSASSKDVRPKEFSTRKKLLESDSSHEKRERGEVIERSTKKHSIWSPIDIEPSNDAPKSIFTKRRSLDEYSTNKQMPYEHSRSFSSSCQEPGDIPAHRNQSAPQANRYFFPPTNDMKPFLTSPTKQQQMAMAWVCLEEYNRQVLANRNAHHEVRGSSPDRSPGTSHQGEREDACSVGMTEDKEGVLNIAENEISHSTDSEAADCNIPMNLSKTDVVDESDISQHNKSRRPFDDEDRKQRVCSIVAN